MPVRGHSGRSGAPGISAWGYWHQSAWYPYDFIDPGEVGGYGGVALYSLGITAGFLAVALVVILGSNHRRVPELPAAAPATGQAGTD